MILGYSDMLARWGREDKNILDEGITSIRSEAENMQQLIEKLLFLARADQKRQAVNKEDVAQMAVDAVDKHKTLIWAPPLFRFVMMGLKHIPAPLFRLLPI